MFDRYLNTIETVMANNHAVFMGTSQAVTLLYLDYKISSKQFKIALENYINKNSLLQQKLVIQNKKWCLQKNSHPVSNFEVYRYEEKIKDFDLILEKEVNNILDYNQVLSKLKIIYPVQNKGCIIILTQHHAIMDTYSAKKILKDLIDSISIDEEEKYYEHFPVWKYFNAKEVADCDIRQVHKPDNDFSQALKIFDNPLPLKWTAVDTWIINPSLLSSMEYYAKKLDCRLNSLLTVIYSIAVMKLLNINNINTYSAVTYRKNNDLMNQLGCLLDVVNINVKIWDIDDSVRRFEREISYIKKHLSKELETTSQILADAKKQKLSFQKAARLCEGLGFTNSGRTDTLKFENDINVLAYRSVANRTSGALLFTYHMSFHKGSLITSVLTSQLLLDKKSIQLFIQNINKYIKIIDQRVKLMKAQD
ncbi:MAG: hypothetical protein M3Z93_04880 [Commensalibacter sp.]|nr:hypothetical protein [Commensalibacter sp.]